MQKERKKAVSVRDPEKYQYAYMLFLQSVPQREICKRVDISSATLNAWKTKGGWDEKRAAKEISLDTIFTKAMKKISDMLDEGDTFSSDAFAKAVSQLKKLKHDTTVDDVIDALTRFGDWLIQESNQDRTIDADFVQQVTQYQDMYVKHLLKNGR